jgi:hypothetical protein
VANCLIKSPYNGQEEIMKKKGFSGFVVVVVLVLVGFLPIFSCATKNSKPQKSPEQILAEAEMELAALKELLTDSRRICDAICDVPDCQCKKEIMSIEKDLIELTVLHTNVSMTGSSHVAEYILYYFWDPQNERSREDLKDFWYALSDPQLNDRKRLTVILFSKGGWDDMLPALINVFYELQSEIPDLQQFLQEVHFYMQTENCGIKMPADNELPWLVLSEWIDSQPHDLFSAPIFKQGLDLSWERKTESTRNTVSRIIEGPTEFE